jgi:alanyl-tRNA synthetase
MPQTQLTGSEIRQAFIDYFIAKGHTFVPSASLVPGGDQTLLFTNAGMVQFKDVFLGTDKRPYSRAVDSQKCMRVAGKHNDLDDVGRDDTHHTFFEMLGNWSFGDYYKKEAIAWAWELLSEVWGLPKDRLWTTCFKDDQGDIPADEEAAEAWRSQPGINPQQVLYFGRKDNFWEMAEIGPCGPCSEIHIDRGPEACDKKGVPGHVCRVNGDCARFLELWNLVFIQYNRFGPTDLQPLPAKHVDTGMGLERIVAVLQNKMSNYDTDLLSPMMDAIQRLTGHSDAQRREHLTPYRVITDHARAATFLIADGVVPGNVGRNYVCRMIVRRAARFGGKLGLKEPFLEKVAEAVIAQYGDFYHELGEHRRAILASLRREEEQFHRTIETGMYQLDQYLERVRAENGHVLSGKTAFELYATYGLPLELTRDVLREQDLDVDESEFHQAMEEHRLASGAGAFGDMAADDGETYRRLAIDLKKKGTLPEEGVKNDPYQFLSAEGNLLALVRDGEVVQSAEPGDEVDVLLPATPFYVESGGQVSDHGVIRASATGKDGWEVHVDSLRKPAAGIVVHHGKVLRGTPHTGDKAIAVVDERRRADIARNHTASHLLHSALHEVLGKHARQAGSSVAPDHLRFDFNHPGAVTRDRLDKIEAIVNERILAAWPLHIELKSQQQAREEGAMALFGEKYGETVRTIAIGDEDPFSYELCGGTHVQNTGDIGLFLIVSEGSAAAGIRRIEAVTGRKAYELVRHTRDLLRRTADTLNSAGEQVVEKTEGLLGELNASRKEIAALRQKIAAAEISGLLDHPALVGDIKVLTAQLSEADADGLRQMSDRFRQKYPHKSVAVLASVIDGSPLVIAAVTEDLVAQGFHAGDLVKHVARPLGGGGGGKPALAQAGGKDPTKLAEALASVTDWVKERAATGEKKTGGY